MDGKRSRSFAVLAFRARPRQRLFFPSRAVMRRFLPSRGRYRSECEGHAARKNLRPDVRTSSPDIISGSHRHAIDRRSIIGYHTSVILRQKVPVCAIAFVPTTHVPTHSRLRASPADLRRLPGRTHPRRAFPSVPIQCADHPASHEAPRSGVGRIHAHRQPLKP